MFDLYLHRQYETLAECFELSAENHWESHDFVNTLFNTEWSVSILTGVSTHEYTCSGFMYEGLEKYFSKKEGSTLSVKVLKFCSYLYRYIFDNTKLTPKQVYEKAPLDLLDKRYGFYHTQDWEYIKNDLGC